MCVCVNVVHLENSFIYSHISIQYKIYINIFQRCLRGFRFHENWWKQMFVLHTYIYISMQKKNCCYTHIIWYSISIHINASIKQNCSMWTIFLFFLSFIWFSCFPYPFDKCLEIVFCFVYDCEYCETVLCFQKIVDFCYLNGIFIQLH